MRTKMPWLAALVLWAGSAHALDFSLPGWGDEEIIGQLNTTVTAGAAVRVESRADDLVGKSNLNPQVCGRENGNLRWQGCQGLFRTQSFTAERLVSAPGQFTMNADDGNLNYDRGDLTQAPFKVTSDLKLSRGDWGIFVRSLYFYDFVNNDFIENHPNEINRHNYIDVANVSVSGRELGLPGTTVGDVRNDSRPCTGTDINGDAYNRDPDNNPATDCGLVYGAGGAVRRKRQDGETLRQIGTDLQLLDALVYGLLPLWGDSQLTVKLGRQQVNWGESTLLFFDSINQANPVNANNLFRVGFQLEELFTPIGMAFIAADLLDNASLEAFYQLEWRPTEAPAPGSFYSPADIGTNNAGPDVLTLGFGSLPDDPDRLGYLVDNPLSGVTNTSIGFRRLKDREPDSAGQFGVALKYYADNLGSGTQFGLYYMNYHARLPYLSVYSVPEACSKNSTSTAEFAVDCVDVPLFHAQSAENDPQGATDSAIAFDAITAVLEYPEDIQMFGVSFNTTVGDFSIQGEIAYRPDAPLQVDVVDLAFAAYGPSATNCHLAPGCEGTSGADLPGTVNNPADDSTTVAKNPDGTNTQNGYGGSDYVIDANGTLGSYYDSFNLTYGHAVGVGRAFPSFIVPYRGMTLGTNPANSYIRGWEYFDTYEFTLGSTYLMGATDWGSKLIGADQIIWLLEGGATWVPDLPAYDVLQLAAPGIFLHASAGADGSGADRSRQACSTNEACSYGVDGGRFNPHQQDREAYPDRISAGYDIVAVILYESVMPGISLRPFLIWKHDVVGTAPGIASNFVEGRILADALLEVRYEEKLSFSVGYNYWGGGGRYNMLRDRDTVRAFVRYQF